MSRTFKDTPKHLSQISKNELELNQVYIREKHYRQDRFQNTFDSCLDCSRRGRNFKGTCRECGEQSIEDLVTVYESLST